MVRETEEHAGGAVQLRHHHALSAVDDERAARGHIRDHAQIDLLHAGLFETLMLFVVAFQLQLGFQWNTVCQSSFEAFVHRVARKIDVIVHELQDEAVSCVGNREILGESPIQALILARFGVRVYLEELLERFQLDIQEVRKIDGSRGRETNSVVCCS